MKEHVHEYDAAGPAPRAPACTTAGSAVRSAVDRSAARRCAPQKKSGRGIWLVLFVVAAVLFVGALVFAIISFTGKNSEADDKERPSGSWRRRRRSWKAPRQISGHRSGQDGRSEGCSRRRPRPQTP